MTYDEVLAQVLKLLQRDKRVAYRVLKRRFGFDDGYVEDLKADLIKAKQLARDEDGEVLVWTGGAPVASSQFPVATPQPSHPRRQTRDPRPDTAERRQLTVLFCDLVGSTALSEQLDPEELREIVRAYQQASAEVIARYEGHIAQYLGDGLLVYFGYPTAHEEDAVRAVRSGLGIVAAVGELKFTPPLQVRVGIHTGQVVVGEIGAGERTERLALGETPNIAARVQGYAEPDTVVTSAATYRLVQGLFECQDLGPQSVKGLSIPLVLYRVEGESAAQSRFEVAVRTGLTPLVGREAELGLLRQHWERAKAGEGQVILLSGEPGIGKSRLVQEFKDQLAHEGVTQIEFRCSPYHQNSALYPIIDHLQRVLQFAREDAPTTKLEKLQHTLSHYRFPQADTVPLLAALLSLPHPAGLPPLTMSTQKQKEKTHAVLVSWLVEEAERQATYSVWEDVHWADPSTLEVLNLVVDQTPTARLYVLVTLRPEFLHPWGNRSHLRQLTLSRLERMQTETMVERVTGGKALPPEVMRQIVVKTDGVPLFVEELTKTVVESRLVKESERGYELTGPLPPLAIPSTLHASLLARLDRLSTVREIAQLGATIGREFSYELMQAVSPLDEVPLQRGLKQLVEAELIYQRGLLPQAQYIFKHALIQDTAYQSLLKSKRQQLHQHIAHVLEERFLETTETQPELVAYHYTEAGLIEQAIPYWQQAGQRASAQSAPAEAITHLSTGLALLKTLPDSPEHLLQELLLQITLGSVTMAAKGYAAPEVEQTYARARELCQQIGGSAQLFPVLRGLVAFYVNRAEFQAARDLSEQLLSLAHRQQDQAQFSEAHYLLGLVSLFLGELSSVRTHTEQGLAFYNPRQYRALGFRTVEDPAVSCHSFAAIALWFMGYPEQALRRMHQAFTVARELASPYNLAFASVFAAWLHQFRREGSQVQERAEAVIALATEQGFPFLVALGISLRGWAIADQGHEEEGIAQLRQGLAAWQAIGTVTLIPYYRALLAEAYGKSGRAEECLAGLAEALTAVDKTGERFYEAELYRLKGELTLKSKVQGPKSKIEEAEEYFKRAICLAQRQQAKSLELRATVSLVRLWQKQGKKDEARRLLAEIYAWFTEGFDTKDLQEAKALIEELSQ